MPLVAPLVAPLAEDASVRRAFSRANFTRFVVLLYEQAPCRKMGLVEDRVSSYVCGALYISGNEVFNAAHEWIWIAQTLHALDRRVCLRGSECASSSRLLQSLPICSAHCYVLP
jgi:hypothetical protein